MAKTPGLIAGAAALAMSVGGADISKDRLSMSDSHDVETRRELVIATTQVSLAGLLDSLENLVFPKAYAGIPGKDKYNNQLAERGEKADERGAKADERGAKADERGAKADERGAKADELNKNINIINYAISNLGEVKGNPNKMKEVMKAIEYIEADASSTQNSVSKQNSYELARKARQILK